MEKIELECLRRENAALRQEISEIQKDLDKANMENGLLKNEIRKIELEIADVYLRAQQVDIRHITKAILDDLARHHHST